MTAQVNQKFSEIKSLICSSLKIVKEEIIFLSKNSIVDSYDSKPISECFFLLGGSSLVLKHKEDTKKEKINSTHDYISKFQQYISEKNNIQISSLNEDERNDAKIDFDIIHSNEIPTVSTIVESLVEYEEYKSNLIKDDVIQTQPDEQVFICVLKNPDQNLKNLNMKEAKEILCAQLVISEDMILSFEIKSGCVEYHFLLKDNFQIQKFAVQHTQEYNEMKAQQEAQQKAEQEFPKDSQEKTPNQNKFKNASKKDILVHLKEKQ